MDQVGVLGTGAWGLALAQMLAQSGRLVHLWGRDAAQIEMLQQTRAHPTRLAGIRFADNIAPTTDLAQLAQARTILAVTPAQTFRQMCRSLHAQGLAARPIILCAKGIERDSGALMTEVAAQELPDWPLAVLSGPSFARDVVQGLPTAVTLACSSAQIGRDLAHIVGTTHFRLYLSDDPLGAEVGGAVKNVLAIACGIVAGKSLGESARAALITRGFAETLRFGAALGARRETLNGLCGLGDLILTCSSAQSRNFALGQALGHGLALPEALASIPGIAEGAQTAPALLSRARALGVDMPISEAVGAILSGLIDVDDAIRALLTRPLRTED